MSDITWSNKVDNQVSPLPAEKKVTAADMNQIKTAVNSKANEDASNVDSRTEWRNRLYAVNTITMSGNLTLTETTPRVLYLNPNGADRTVDVSDLEGLPVFISNAGGANTIDVGGLVTLFAGDTVSVLSDGTSAVVEGHTVANYAKSIYEDGDTFFVNNSASIVSLNSNDIEVVLDRPGKWLVQCNLMLDGAGLTISGSVMNAELYAPSYMPESDTVIQLGSYTTYTGHISSVSMPPVFIDVTGSPRTVSLWAYTNNNPDAGTLNITAASIVAYRIGA